MSESRPVELLIERARVALHGKAFSLALSELEQAVSLVPGWADVHNLHGSCLSQLRRFDEAVRAFDRALAINPAYLEALANRAEALRGAGRHEEAAATSARLSELADGTADERYPPGLVGTLANLHAALGDLYAGHGLLLEACEQYRRACQLAPRFVDLRHRLGRTLIELGLLETAVRELRTALDISPGYVEARANLGLALCWSGRHTEAKAAWEACLADRPDWSEVREHLARLDDDAPVATAEPQRSGVAGWRTA